MLAKLTIKGLHEYTDGAIWDNLEFPEGIDKEVAVNEILRQCSEFSTVYPSLEFLVPAIKAWGKKWYFTFQKWYEAMTKEYEPLWNVDAKTVITDAFNKSGQNSGSGDNVHQNASYDSDTFKNAEKDTMTSSGSFTEGSQNRHEEVRQGNQGMTKSQDMLMDEYNVRTWNLYSHIADIFANEMCICIYN